MNAISWPVGVLGLVEEDRIGSVGYAESFIH